MLNYVYGFVTSAMVVSAVKLADSELPNGLWYWVDLYLPL